ncbi:hypothetical protein [Sulfurimonas sp.]
MKRISAIALIMLIFSGCGKSAEDYNIQGKESLKKSDYDSAFESFKQSCDNGYAEGCYNFASLLQKFYEDSDINQKIIAQSYEKSCDGGYIDGCNKVATLYAWGRGVKQDYIKASQLYKKACDKGNQLACYNLGNMYGSGDGVKQDFSKQNKFFKKACIGNNIPSQLRTLCE